MKHLYSLVLVLIALTSSHLTYAQIIPNVTYTNDNTLTCSGTASAAPTGGAGAYAYMWSTGETTSSISNLCAGNYMVVIQDANQDTASFSFTITNPCSNIILTSSVTNTTGGNCNGTIQVMVSGGTGPYVFSVSGGSQTGQSLFTNICPGTYTITVVDANGCSAVATATVFDGCVGFTAIVSSTPESGSGICDGSAICTAYGGTAPFNYSWNTGANTQSISNLCSGFYTATCIDANGCMTSQPFIVTGTPPPITINLTTTGDLTGSCIGEALVAPTGGSGSYSFLWSTGETTSYIGGLCVGSYTVTVWDSVDTASLSFTITNPCTNFTGTFTSTGTINGSCTGTSTVNASGGLTPYEYSWDNGATFNLSNTASNLCAGIWDIICRDANGCILTQNIVITDSISSISNISVNLTSIDDYTSNCSGSAYVSPTGGIAPYTISWSNGQSGILASNLCAGIYSVTVSDASDSITVDFIIADSSTIYGNNPYPNGSINDTLYTDLVTNCIIDYSSIDSASLYQAVYDPINQNLYVTWAVYSPTDTVYISDTLGWAGLPGYYGLTISVYCPNKSGNDFFKIESVIYFDGTAVYFSTLGVDEQALDNITIYPNPFSNSIVVDNKDGVIQSLKLIDLNGRVLSEMSSVNSGLVKLDQLESISSGTYLLILSGENTSKTYKVIK